MFASASASGADWRAAIDAALAELPGELPPPKPAGANLGFIYVTETLAPNFADVVARARAETGVADWVGAVGLGVCGTGAEYFDEHAVALMIIETPPGGYQLFERAGDARAPNPAATDLGGIPFVVLHVDSTNQTLFEDMETVSEVTNGYLVGGLTANAGAGHQVAGGFTGGGIPTAAAGTASRSSRSAPHIQHCFLSLALATRQRARGVRYEIRPLAVAGSNLSHTNAPSICMRRLTMDD